MQRSFSVLLLLLLLLLLTIIIIIMIIINKEGDFQDSISKQSSVTP